jgi:hypothetical protein
MARWAEDLPIEALALSLRSRVKIPGYFPDHRDDATMYLILTNVGTDGPSGLPLTTLAIRARNPLAEAPIARYSLRPRVFREAKKTMIERSPTDLAEVYQPLFG